MRAGVSWLDIKLTLGDRLESTGFPADRYLAGRLALQGDISPRAMSETARTEFRVRSAELFDDARRRVASEPGVSAVAFADRVPGMNHPYRSIQLEDPLTPGDSVSPAWARVLSVDEGFFAAMDAPIVGGRGFQPADLESEIGVAVVDQGFVRGTWAGATPSDSGSATPVVPGKREADGTRSSAWSGTWR